VTFAELVAAALAQLERAAIPYMVTGSIASTKIDFIIRRDRPFSIEEFGRRRPADLLGTPGYIATVEDMVVAKLEWAVATDSERQLRDVAGMLAVGGDDVDRDYVLRWVDALGLGDVWRRVSG
jgi:hypothetical protein